ncbi:2OG-Fe(II) oxygenase [Pseudoalteromonas fenneropenaei]|uniref:2OG-Fe(II) oxygenase n=1 Tax=Pseudoalteromonas fenneropenaei TaxID=1737459 RepID=A0ABV7CJQ0_9GAMM
MLAYQLSEAPFDTIAHDLRSHGICILPKALPLDVLEALQARLAQLSQHDFNEAGIGRSSDHEKNRTIRRDKIHWLDDSDPLEAKLLAHMQEMQDFLNRRLFMGLFSYECHFAHYQVGDFYKKHLDAFKGRTNRVLTTVLYLNPDWQAEDGGELVIYAPDDHERELMRVKPEFGTFVTFLSDEYPHEVLPAKQSRFSVAGWFRVNDSINGHIDPPR